MLLIFLLKISSESAHGNTSGYFVLLISILAWLFP